MFRAWAEPDTSRSVVNIYLYDLRHNGKYALMSQSPTEWTEVPEGTESPQALRIDIDLATELYKALGRALQDPDEVGFARRYVEDLRADYIHERIRVDKLVEYIVNEYGGANDGP